MLFALCVTILAGLCTGLGGIMVLFIKNPNVGLLGISNSFAAGVMLAVSLGDMLPRSIAGYEAYMPPFMRAVAVFTLVGLGMVCGFLLGRCVPEPDLTQVDDARVRAMRSGIVTALTIILHNLPEGVLTMFTSYTAAQTSGAFILAVALHNIPEGLAVAVPIYYATNSKGKGVGLAFASGMAEPLGAILAFALLRPFFTAAFLNGVLLFIAGVMCWISIGELIPAALQNSKPAQAIGGLAMGILIMCIGISIL
ncbi:MAG: ZIP family metal transporter [Oscillospiraceae bacterium]|nr:ZIP family metal transporter [Oscillospiraceae bacterium]